MSKKHDQQLKDRRNRERARAKQKRRQTQWLMFGTLLVVAIIVAIVAISANKKDDHAGDQTTPVKAVNIDVSNQPIVGKADAPVTIVEFGDYRCTYCRQFEDTIYPSLKQKYIDSGKAKFYFINYAFLGEGSDRAANAAEAVYAQSPEDFWAFHDALFQHQGSEQEQWVTKELLISIAKDSVPSLDMEKFKKALEEDTYQDQVQQDVALGESLGIQGTPVLFVNGLRVAAPLDLGSVSKAVDSAVKEAQPDNE